MLLSNMRKKVDAFYPTALSLEFPNDVLSRWNYLLWIKIEQKDIGYDPFRVFYNKVIFYSGCLLQ